MLILFLKRIKKQNQSKRLFDEKPKEFRLPELYSHPLEPAYDELEINWLLIKYFAF